MWRGRLRLPIKIANLDEEFYFTQVGQPHYIVGLAIRGHDHSEMQQSYRRVIMEELRLPVRLKDLSEIFDVDGQATTARKDRLP
jgi:hypothetical protein